MSDKTNMVSVFFRRWDQSREDNTVKKTNSDWDLPDSTPGVPRRDATPTPGPLFNRILLLLMQLTLEDQERHLLVKVIDRVLYNLDELLRRFVHKIMAVIESPLIDEDYYARVQVREIVSNLGKAASLVTMIAGIRLNIDNIDEYVRNTTAKAFSLIASALEIPVLLLFLKVVVANLGTSDIDARLEELLIHGILYAFQEQTNDDANVMLNGFDAVLYMSDKTNMVFVFFPRWDQSREDNTVKKTNSDWDLPDLTPGVARRDATPTPGPLFNRILLLLMQLTLEDQERHLLVKVIDRVLYNLDELVRLFVHKIMAVIEPPLIDEDYYARVQVREIVSNLGKAASLVTMIAGMCLNIDNINEYVRNTTAKAFSLIAFALEIPVLLLFLKVVVANLGTSDIDACLEELLIHGILYAFQEQTNNDANVMLNGFDAVVNALGQTVNPYLPQIRGTIKWHLNNKIAVVMKQFQEEQLMGHLWVVLYIAKAIEPQHVLATLLNNLKVQEHQNCACTTVAIAIVAKTCSPFTILPALMNEYQVSELNVQDGELKSMSFLFEYIGQMAKDYIYAITPFPRDALVDRDFIHTQTVASTVKHMVL
ncbi:hypothetical protein RHMOL_Rhmol11G0190400 [Rhododendron molle]|uniref:Uncharacterized protein n=1 Tax=Rhododendron molle TaxID=49168 RepID=A0ACC0LU35_RHOML|nr:hypothetical protein RHMOL_Rhmol11G0190400 [Rhododendron molle]